MHARLFDALIKELCDPLIRKENIFQVRSKEFAPHQRGSCQVDIGSSCCPRTQTKFVVKSLSQLLVAVIHNPKDNPELLPISRQTRYRSLSQNKRRRTTNRHSFSIFCCQDRYHYSCHSIIIELKNPPKMSHLFCAAIIICFANFSNI